MSLSYSATEKYSVPSPTENAKDTGVLAALYRRAAERVELLREALQSAAAAYLGPDAHTPEGRISRYLEHLGETFDPRAN